MEEVLRSLGRLLLQAIPTFIIVVLLHFYLKRIYFRPFERLLAQRGEATEGVRKLAEQSLAKASEKAGEYESALNAARGEIYHEQERFRQKLREEHAQAVQDARHKAQTMVKEANQQLAAELLAAKDSLRQQTDSLAEEIVRTILRRRAV